MFTGIIEEVGTIIAVDLDSPQSGLIIEAHTVLDDAHLGDSIAINGTCLTVTNIHGSQFAVGVVPETLRRTNLGNLQSGDPVNLERPLQPQSRLGGHFVQGHVDGTGTVMSVTPDGNARSIQIGAEPHILRYIVEKGFVAIDGISLTVTGVDEAGFGISLVPYTQENVARGLMMPGYRANLEVDILAKYVERLVIH